MTRLSLGHFLQFRMGHLGSAIKHRWLAENDVFLVIFGVLLHPFHALEPHQLQLTGAVAYFGSKALLRAFAN